MRYNAIPVELCEIISEKYPTLNFEIYNFYNYSNVAYGLMHKWDDQSVHDWECKQWEIMGIDKDEYPNEYSRYKRELMTKEYISNQNFDDRIKLQLIQN